MKKLTVGAVVWMACLGLAQAADAAQEPDKRWEDGTEYFGGLRNNKLHGEGTIVWTDGTRFSGTFENGLREGVGKLKVSDTQTIVAEFKNDEVVPGSVEYLPIASIGKVPVSNKYLEEMSAQLDAEFVAFVNGWAESWSQQDLPGYFSYYSDTFVPANGLLLAEWKQQRSERISRPNNIQVDTKIRSAQKVSADIAVIVFEQTYQSDVYRDRTLKRVGLVKSDSQWRIAAEVVLDLLD